MKSPSYSVMVASLLCLILQGIGYLKLAFDPPVTVSKFLPSMCGALVLGRLSDCLGRRAVLWIVNVGCLASTIAAICFPHAFWPVRSNAFFGQNFGILKAYVGDRCKTSNASVVETALVFSLLNIAGNLALYSSGLGSLLSDSWDSALKTTLCLQLIVSPTLLCLVKESGPHAEPKTFFVMTGLRERGVIWALCWILLITLPAFLFGSATISAASSPLANLCAGMIGTASVALVLQMFGAPLLLTVVALALFLLRLVELTSAAEVDACALALKAMSAAVGGMGNVLDATLLTIFGSSAELGGLFGISDAMANFWGATTPTIAAAAGASTNAFSMVISAALVPFTLLVRQASIQKAFATAGNERVEDFSFMPLN